MRCVLHSPWKDPVVSTPVRDINSLPSSAFALSFLGPAPLLPSGDWLIPKPQSLFSQHPGSRGAAMFRPGQETSTSQRPQRLLRKWAHSPAQAKSGTAVGVTGKKNYLPLQGLSSWQVWVKTCQWPSLPSPVPERLPEGKQHIRKQIWEEGIILSNPQ